MYPYALIGNCHTSALINATGSVEWMCLPRPDSPPVFGRLLDPDGGHFSIVSPLASSVEPKTSQAYLPNTNILVTTVTLANGDVRLYYIDTEYYVPIKIDVKRFVRGAEREYETVLGDYKEVAGWFMPFSIETNVKGRQDKSKIVFERIEANVDIDDSRFKIPSAATAPK